MVDNDLKLYYKLYSEMCKVADRLKKKNIKVRKPNFPEVISEYLVQKISGAIKGKTGDLIHGTKKIEVKCFASKGPISFGPSEKWDSLVLVDATKLPNVKIINYTISNDDEKWKNIKVSRGQTFEEQCKSKRRPRLTYECLRKQIARPSQIISSDISDILEDTNPIPKLKI